jgi:predicted GIY-YIG superfamily endonuclease
MRKFNRNNRIVTKCTHFLWKTKHKCSLCNKNGKLRNLQSFKYNTKEDCKNELATNDASKIDNDIDVSLHDILDENWIDVSLHDIDDNWTVVDPTQIDVINEDVEILQNDISENLIANTLQDHPNANDVLEETNNIVNTTLPDCYCTNCKRQHTIHSNSDIKYKNLYDLIISERTINKSSLRKKYSTITMRNNARDIIIVSSDTIKTNLCDQCFEYFNLSSKSRTIIYKHAWQVIFWKILSSNQLYETYGIKLWKLIPIPWRKWWFASVTKLLPVEWYLETDISDMDSIIIDVTLKKECLENSIKNGILGEIIESCDQYLLPLVKCPWGCTEYYHLAGQLSIENIFLRYIAQYEMERMMSQNDKKYGKSITIGSRNDYLSLENNVEVEHFLWNPKWIIGASICFVNSFPVFLTCRNHNRGCKKFYLHPPKNPFGNLCAKSTDQVASAVVVPRTIRATKAHKYSHAFNLQEMRCQFNGIDTLSITDKPLFNNDSILSDIYESFAIKGRTDVQAHVAQLSHGNKDLSYDTSKNLLDRAEYIMKNYTNAVYNNNDGSTFLTVKESMQLQKQIKKGVTSTVFIIKENGSVQHLHYTPKWPSFLYYVHVANKHGSPFPVIPVPSKEHVHDTRILWIMSVLHVCVQEIWQKTAQNVTTPDNEWNGWLLLYLTEFCFPHLLKKINRQSVFLWNDFKSKFDKEKKIYMEMFTSRTNNATYLDSSSMEIYIHDENFAEDINIYSVNESNSYVSVSRHGSDASTYSAVFSNDNEEVSYEYTDEEMLHENEIGHELNNNGQVEIDMSFVLNHGPIRNNDEMEVETNIFFEVGLIKKLFEKNKSIAVIGKNEPWDEQHINNNISIIMFVKEQQNDTIAIENEMNTDDYLYNIIPQHILSEEMWDLRLICFTQNYVSRGKEKWNGTAYCRHNGDMFPNWWRVTSESIGIEKVDIGEDIYNLDVTRIGQCNIAVFVQRSNIENTMYRDTFLNTIGGQSKCICKEHKVPLVVATSKNNNLKCCYNSINNTNNPELCTRKNIFASCPIKQCSSCICTHHFKNTNLQSPIEVPILNINNEDEGNVKDVLENEVEQDNADNYVLDPQFSYEFDSDSSHNSDNSITSIEDHQFENLYDENDINENENLYETEGNINNTFDNNTAYGIPCSSSGAGGGLYIAEECKANFIGAHVILNNCGSLLARRGSKLKGSKIQQRFLQSIVATSNTKSIPLLYPEAMLFPSIFCKENEKDASPIGAIPCCLMAHDTTLSNSGFASLIDHFRSRITNTSLLTSTNNNYIAFCFDNFLNLQTRQSHTRMILHRGLWNCGLGKSITSDSNGTMYNVDSIQSRPIVNKLAAAVAEEQATYFYTHTCNQEEHFGIREIKKWIDSSDLENIILSKFGKMQYLKENILRYQEELRTSIIQSAAVSILRNWMEVSSIWMNYLKNSKEKPLGKITRIWWRHEYQETKGNLSHIHALLWVDKTEEQVITLDRIRGSTLDIICEDEIDSLIQEKIIRNSNEVIKVRDMATKVLRHVCNDRCKRRTGTGDNDLKCRVTNNGTENPFPTKHFFKEYEVLYSSTCIRILSELQLMFYNKDTKQYTMHDALKAVKHFPPAVAGEGNISACNGRLFAACLSNNNLKFVTSYLASRYLTKYVATIDQNNRVYFSINANDAKEIKAKMQFLYNTKITSSNINEKKRHEMSRDKKKPQGRAISLMEITSMLLGYPQVYTDIKFIHIPTVPLAERCAIEKGAQIKKIFKGRNFVYTKVDDLDPGEILPQYFVRNIFLQDILPKWRQYTKSESLIMIDQMFSNLSIDNVTTFGMRPPELRFIRHIKMYYRWFYFKTSTIVSNTFSNQVKMYENFIKTDLIDTMWIDGCGRNVFIRPNAVKEVIIYINSRENSDFIGTEYINQQDPNMIPDTMDAKDKALELFTRIQLCIEQIIDHNIISEDQKSVAEYFLNVFNISDLKLLLHEHFPVVWFSSIKPSHGTRWLLHLLISMGEFENEYNLYCKSNIISCFISCKLISENYENHDNDIKHLAKRYILEQLNYIPGGSKQFDRNVVAAYQTLRHELLFDMPISSDIPPVLYTQLQDEIPEDCKIHIETARKKLLQTTLCKIEGKTTLQFPLLDNFLNATKRTQFPWKILDLISCGVTQSSESFQEQLQVLKYSCERLHLFLSATTINIKNIIICGGPGVGKTTLLQLLILYSASLGLCIHLSSVMSERSCELGGMHLSKMFCIPTIKNKNPSIIAEKAIYTLLRQPKQFSLLQKLEILAIDEFGQVSAELLSIIDIILRTIRKNSLFMGGVLIIATMDHMQLPPVNGRPPLLSPHMLTSFSFRILLKSVRASQDSNLQEIQNITRMNYNELQPLHILRFRYLIETYCTHVEDFNNPLLTVEKLRLFGKVSAKRVAEESLLKAKHNEFRDTLIECISEDFESTLESQWEVASATTTAVLSRKVKEPRKLCFYPYATFEITFNDYENFSQGQIALLANMPTEQEIKDFSPISIYVAPDGCKTFPSSINHETLVQQGWCVKKMTKCREHSVYLGNGIEAKRRQYGLRHRIASTIHAGMGQDLQHVVTRVTDKTGDPNYHLWDKEQVVVLLSRTNYAKDIIFVGDKKMTSKALSDLLTKRSQYTEYTSYMLTVLSTCEENIVHTKSLNLKFYPYRAIDFEIPYNTCGYVYLIKSLSPYMQQTTYIGETNNIVRRIQEHNKLRGSNSTNNALLLPWALVCFVTGFSLSSSTVRKQFEQLWKIERNNLKNRYRRNLSLQEMCNAGKLVMEKYKNEELRFIECCSFESLNSL